MRALYMTDFEQLELGERPAPGEPSSDQILVKVVASALGVTQLQLLEGLLHAGQLPRILGHEIVGTVEQVGQVVSGLAPGDLVVVDPLVGCGACPRCLAAEEEICPHHHYLGMNADGGYADYVLVPARQAFRLPPSTPPEEAVMLASAAPTAVHAVRRAGVKPLDTVVVLGVGSIGLMLVQVARAWGATRIVAVDLDDEWLAVASPFVDATVNNSEGSAGEVERRIRAAAERDDGADVVFESAGTAETLGLALDTVRAGGTVLALGLLVGRQSIAFADFVQDFSLRELTIRSTYAYTRADFPLVTGLYAAGKLDVRRLRGEVLALADVPAMIAVMRREGLRGRRHVVRL
jgi:L-iditol 2-dehydrogenase